MVGLTELGQMFKMKDIRVSWLLQAWWIAGILPILIASIPSSRLASFHHLVLGFARRGKIMTSSNSSQKFWIFEKFTVPQKFFLHFYVFSVVWTTTLLALTWHYAYKVAPLDSGSVKYMANHLTGGAHIFSLHKSHSTSVAERYWVWRLVFLLLLMEIQVVSRLYETLYVFKYSHSARMHIFAYFTGYYFYVAVPLSLCHGCVLEILNFAADQVAELSVMGQEKVSVIEYDFWGYLKPMTKLGWCQLVGAAVFFWGWVHQRNCHAILGSLRRHKTDRDKHVIPRGDWFDYVSSPHYFAEMVIYAGIVIASGGTDLTIFLAFAFTVANLSFVAGEIHRWYLKKFEDYPQNRKAVIPFIY
ncbi:unnamed protein product [Rhodiola kirilowii]